MSVRLYVKLPKAQLEKEGVEKMFSDFQDSFTTKLIRERKKKECRGFGFVTVPTDEAAEAFINKYNDQPFVYDGETFKDEEGKEFLLMIEKALPRSKNDESSEDSKSESNVELSESPKTDKKPVKSPRTNKNNSKNRKGPKAKGNKPVSVAESIKPDPRWADELSKLKEMFTTQTNS
jgi:RNA recognition motif-containing protein